MLLLEDHRLWLLLALAAISLGVRLTQPLPWSSVSIFQPLIVIAGTVVPAIAGDAQLALWTGWCLFLFFHVPGIIANFQTARAIGALDAEALSSWARVSPWLHWGMPGIFWQDIYLSYAHYIEGRESEALALLNRWLEYKKLPRSLKAVPLSYRLSGELLLWQWQRVIDDYKELEKLGTVNPSTCFMAARAYLELGDPENAEACIKAAHIDEIIYPLSSLSTHLLPYFALTGATLEFDRMIKVTEAIAAPAPPAMLTYWRARLAISRGERELAYKLLDETLTEATHPLYIKRAKALKENLEKEESIVRRSGEPHVIWSLFKRAAFIQEILAPRRRSLNVEWISFICIAVFLLSNSFLVPLGLTSPINLDPAACGADYQHVVVEGQYWRLVTYLFYHASFLHIASNLYALYIFGRITENLFGSARFLGIFFVGGILSGVAHVFLSKALAVGASGAIQAIFASCAVAIFRLKHYLPPALRTRYLSFMGGMTLFQIVLDQFIPFIAVFAHLGGLVSGLALGAVTAVRDPSKQQGFEDGEVDGTQKFI